MTFGKLRSITNSKNNGNNNFELLRFCSKINTNIVGGASKLFSHFLKTYNPEKIISFSTLDFGKNTLYEKLGFKFIKYTGLNYWWAKDKRYHRSNFMKHKLVKEGADPNKTEAEIMQERKFIRVWGLGNNKWEWSK